MTCFITVLIHINDIAHVSSKVFLLFGDDSNVFLSGEDPNDIIKTMNREIDNVVDCLRINKLSLNIKKTHLCYFGHAGQRCCWTLT